MAAAMSAQVPTRGQIASAREVEARATVRAEVVVVGLGAGGGMVFHDLSLAGRDVLGLEIGPAYDPAHTTLREEEMLPRLFAEGASRATEDMSVRVLQGQGVGGSTLHNTNLCKRLPHELLDRWAWRWGLDDLLGPSLQEDFAAVESLLNVHPVPDARVNRNNQLLEAGLERLGWRGGRLMHNRDGDCQQSGYCELGCPNNGKRNTAKTLVPPGLQAGGRILTEARAVRILTAHGRACGVEVEAVDPATGRALHTFTVLAERVVLAGSATGSAALALASDLPDPHRLCGRRLHLHPGMFVVGLFEEPVRCWEGTPQAVECTEFLGFGEDAPHRVWIVSGAAHPGGAAGLLPGFGPEHGRLMRKYPHVAVLIAMLHDHSSGSVAPSRDGRVLLRYSVERSERAQIATGLRACGQLLFAAGAEQVLLPIRPRALLGAAEAHTLQDISARQIAPFNPSLVAVHPMSTMAMGADPATSVVNPGGEHHHVPGLFVADGSLFPTSIGGPPQLPIYTFARRVARGV